MRGAAACIVAVAGGASASEAVVEWLPAESRAIPLSDSASRDAPVIELAYGPTVQASLGGEKGLVHRSYLGLDYRLSVYGLAAYELQTVAWPPPEFLRTLGGVTASFAVNAPASLGGILEISIGFGGEWATTVGPTEAPAAMPGDIPFGGGGLFLLPEIAWRRDFGPWQLTARLSERIDLPGVLLVFGERALADVVADAVDDSFTNVPAAEVALRWTAMPGWQPLCSVHGDVLFPEDTSARTGWFVRGIVGLAITGVVGQLIPFLSADLGNGQGLLLNTREARFSAGVRYVAP
jgi:hypothetical protein